MWICPYRYNHANPPIFIKCCESAHICKSALPLKIQKVLRKATNGTTHAIKSLRFHFNCQYGLMNFVWINSLWPGDAPQRQRCGSTLAQEMVWCLTSNVDISSTRFCGIHVRLISWKIKEFNLQHEFITASSSRGQWVNTLLWYTVLCCYSAVNFPPNIHERHPIAGPSGRGMGCLLWVQPLIDILPHFLQWCVQYHVKLDRVIHVITALHCNYVVSFQWSKWSTSCVCPHCFQFLLALQYIWLHHKLTAPNFDLVYIFMPWPDLSWQVHLLIPLIENHFGCAVSFFIPWSGWPKDERDNHIDGLVQDCSISSVLAMEILQSCTKLLI